MSKEHLLQEFTAAYEQLIQAATEAAERGASRQGDTWGPREVVAHLAGWEVMATVRIPAIVAGMPPLEFEDQRQSAVMADAINATIVTMMGDQSLGALCGLLRRAYQSDLEILRKLDDTFFQAGQYVYGRTKAAIDHCQEHMDTLGLNRH
ncbi:MAG TPA: ClbS/DfsB family four-helix bundle protein [Ktedonobacterales bacterium]|jgi:hypothetical protein